MGTWYDPRAGQVTKVPKVGLDRARSVQVGISEWKQTFPGDLTTPPTSLLLIALRLVHLRLPKVPPELCPRLPFHLGHVPGARAGVPHARPCSPGECQFPFRQEELFPGCWALPGMRRRTAGCRLCCL